jgi:TPP-dependent pyruvate/acetoin dehydrogenase alpha subunit
MATEADDPGGLLVRDEEVDATLVERLYRRQVLARTFDEKAVRLHRQGRIGTYAPMAGQEATQVGTVAAMDDADWLFPTYRDHAMYLARGFELEDVLLHLRGQGNYVDQGTTETLRTFPPTIPIATQLPHAVGVGMASDYDTDGSLGVHGDESGAVLASFGDGATSEGDFHEALNWAGVFDAPVVFLCQNNQYAISMPVDRQTASATIAQKADAYGFDGVRVDGDDVLAVYDAVGDALERARAGEGPTLVEAVTYRRGAHTTTDDPSKYRDEDAPEDHEDPVEVTRDYLRAHADWTPEDEAAVREWADERVASAVDAVEGHPDPEPGQMFDHVFAAPPEKLARQRREVPEEPEVDR